MAEKQNTPEIRFEGFTDPWEQRKLGELLLERNEQAPQSDQYPLMAFIANQGIAPKGDRYDRSALVNDIEGKLYKRTEKGDFIYSSNNLETGSIGLNKYGNACISPVYSIFQPSGIADSDFLGRRLVRKDFIHEMVKWRQGVIYGQWRIHETDFLRLNIAVPSVNEQRLIGKLLDNLDSLITLHQRKYDKLCTVKKSMLDKMFPKPGKTEPEIRFEGFTDPWEQRKFGELYRPVSEKNDMSFGRDRIISVANMYFNSVVYVAEDSYLATYNVMRLGDIAFEGNRSKLFAHGRFVENTIGDGIVSHVFKVFRPVGNNIDLSYWKHAINNEKLMKDVLTRSTKASTMMHELVSSDFLEESTLVPSLDEQRAIGTAIDSIDNLITLHQRKLELLRNIKKSLLDRMFV
ncbi:restriction endonuclease subunit S [Ellagibacter isourolithinifaciens]|uniref:restriction endonuclease subunit S n=1 Tax=Ellagibacter isourolithinifaciens TaxID=2137581 RepID=UPI003AF083D6